MHERFHEDTLPAIIRLIQLFVITITTRIRSAIYEVNMYFQTMMESHELGVIPHQADSLVHQTLSKKIADNEHNNLESN